MEKKYTWHKLADNIAELAFPDSNLLEKAVAGRKVCLVLNKEKLLACSHVCPHAGGSLAGGYVDVSGNIVCPLHRYKFDPQNGRNVSGEGYYLKTFPTQLRPDGIFIGFEENKFFNWLK